MADDKIDYPALVQAALRGIVRGVLARAAASGLPGDHHFYIGFSTGFAGVRLAPRLRARFPDEMTIVLQHQFRDLEVDDDRFAVTLSFDGKSERVTVPFSAVTSFGDPSVDFGLRFEPAEAAAPEAPAAAESDAEPAGESPPGGGADGGETVVAVDFMRRRVADGRKQR